MLLAAYNDIENNGTANPNLLEGWLWLCPIYKKKTDMKQKIIDPLQS